MKRSKLVTIVLIMIISFSILLVAKDTLAANSNLIDMTNNIIINKNTTGNTTGNNTSSTGGNNTGNKATTNNAGNNVLKTNNTSNYNNSSLPKTGIEDSISGIVLVVVLGISAVYAYNKIQYYKNI